MNKEKLIQKLEIDFERFESNRDIQYKNKNYKLGDQFPDRNRSHRS